MTRVCIIGSSHVGALKQAQPQIKDAFPGVQLAYFAVPGGVFRRCELRNGILKSRPANDREAAMVININGELTMDLSDFDHIWIIGHRYGFGAVLQAWIDGEGAHEKMTQLVHDSIDRIADQFGRDDRITLTPAPYPALRSRAPGPNQERRMAQIMRHPDRETIFDAFETTITTGLNTAGYRALLQPSATRAAPFATNNSYLNEAVDFQTGERLDGDLRHMNSAYGAALFHHFATERLGVAA